MSNTTVSTGLEELMREGKYLSTPAGNSMWLLLKNRENAVEIVRAEDTLQKYDIALYVADDGRTVLHRVMDVDKDRYVFCGDNNVKPEIVDFDQVVGVATRFYRKGRWVAVDDKGYQRYVKLWCGLYPVRKYILRARNVLGRLKSSIKKPDAE